MRDSSFTEISCVVGDCAVLYDGLFQVATMVTSTSFSDSNASFYDSAGHQSHSELIFGHFVVDSSKLWKEDGNALLHFDINDDVQIKAIEINYVYDAEHCQYAWESSNYEFPNYVSGAVYECSNPLTIIDNAGLIEIRDIQINVDIVNGVEATANQLQYTFEDVEGHGFFVNDGKMFSTSTHVS